jgi:hypothetical protein
MSSAPGLGDSVVSARADASVLPLFRRAIVQATGTSRLRWTATGSYRSSGIQNSTRSSSTVPAKRRGATPTIV